VDMGDANLREYLTSCEGELPIAER
jgi:hypothetical protein